jgi:hypothetical protein
MSDMRYNSEVLRQGGRISRQASDMADTAGTTVNAAPVSASPFGNVSPAGSLAGVLTQAQQNHHKGAMTAATNRNTAGDRADVTATAGDDLVVVTTAAANSGVAQNVATGMA